MRFRSCVHANSLVLDFHVRSIGPAGGATHKVSAACPPAASCRSRQLNNTYANRKIARKSPLGWWLHVLVRQIVAEKFLVTRARKMASRCLTGEAHRQLNAEASMRMRMRMMMSHLACNLCEMGATNRSPKAPEENRGCCHP